MKWIGLLSCAVLTQSQAASFNCAAATTTVEKAICSIPMVSKLDDELAQVYRQGVAQAAQPEVLKAAQLAWLKVRNTCAKFDEPEDCLRYTYRKRLVELRPPARHDDTGQSHPATGKPKGEYFLSRVEAFETTGICSDFTRNLNQYRHLEFTECDPRLSPKYPQFSRPTWEPVAYDLKTMERWVKDYSRRVNSPPRESAQAQADAEREWQDWLKNTLVLHQAGKVKVWRTRIDIDKDGKPDTLLRVVPYFGFTLKDDRYPGLPYGCNYNQGRLFVPLDGTLDPGMPPVFNRQGQYHESDIIYDYASDRAYRVTWDPQTPSGIEGQLGQGARDIGATSHVKLSAVSFGLSPYMKTICLIDWVPTGRYKPAKGKSK